MCCYSMKMFQTPTQNLIAASATYCLYWEKKKKIKGISKFCELKWELPVWVTPTTRSCGRKYLKTWNYLALIMLHVLRDHCLCKYDCAFAICFCLQHEECRNCGAQRGDIYPEILWFESLSPAQILSVVFKRQNFRLEINCNFCAEMNFLYLYSPIKIHMLVRNSDGCIPSDISNQPTFWFLPLPVIGCSTLHCEEMFTECLEWWQNLFLCLVHFLGSDSLKASEKHLCELGWPLAGLTGWAEVEDVFANEGFF